MLIRDLTFKFQTKNAPQLRGVFYWFMSYPRVNTNLIHDLFPHFQQTIRNLKLNGGFFFVNTHNQIRM
jgi:hypothetical protein